MINFTKRIAYLKEKCEREIKNEKLAEYHLRAISHIIEPDSISPYSDCLYVYVYVKDVEEAEMRIIPALSEVFEYGKWKSFVDEDSVSYEADFDSFGYRIHVNIYWKEIKEGTCSILAFPTGKTRKISKLIEIDEPIMEFKVQCSE